MVDKSAREDRVKTVQATLEGITKSNDDKALLDGLGILHRLLSNILLHPTEDKYRTIKRSIPKIEQTLFSLKGNVVVMLLACGFVEVAP
jgi:hypothetical protein